MKIIYIPFILVISYPLQLHAQQTSSTVFTTDKNITSSANQLCAGNNGENQKNTYGSFCLSSETPHINNHDLRTYAMQVAIKSGNYPTNNNDKNTVNDIVAGYFGTRLYAYSGNGWGLNTLVHAYPNSGSVIGEEIDVNNFSGCDSAGVNGDQTTGGSNPFIAKRSDGSPCPIKIGLLVTGVANRISGTAVDISAVSNQHGRGWQNGITIIGGYVIEESELATNTLARTNWNIKGNHIRGFDASEASYINSVITLNANSFYSGRILWTCTEKCKFNGFDNEKTYISVNNDSELELSSNSFVYIKNLKENIENNALPASSTQPCKKGKQIFGAPNNGKIYYHYVCVSDNKWVRSKPYTSF